MEQRLSLITLGVADLARATRFYEDVIGWKKVEGPEGVSFFDLNGLVFALWPHAELAKDMAIAEEALPHFRGTSLAYNARSEDEVNRIFADLKARGATIVKEPQRVFWGGYAGYFADIDGHHWEVAFNPFWTVRADGRLSMTPPAQDSSDYG
jgi:catechol 2,3-dioxygenase-like lactoylglutathione lyase family enzyme